MESMVGLIFPVIFFLFMDRVIIPKDEKVFEAVFGKAYLRYKSLVMAMDSSVWNLTVWWTSSNDDVVH